MSHFLAHLWQMLFNSPLICITLDWVAGLFAKLAGHPSCTLDSLVVNSLLVVVSREFGSSTNGKELL